MSLKLRSSWRRAALQIGAFSAGVLVFSACSTFAAPPYDGPPRDDHDGKRFKNPEPMEEKGFGDFLRWMRTRDREPWLGPKNREYTYAKAPPTQVGDGELRVTFINHATLLVQIDGVNILTDPVFSKRVGPRPYLGVKRKRPPGIRFEDLPPIDVVVVSHNHYDHFDVPTLRRLADAHQPLILVGLGSKGILDGKDVSRVEELGWGDRRRVTEGHVIHRTAAQHFSSRGLTDRDTNQWGAFVFESPHGSVYFAGDTGWGSHFEEAGEHFDPIRLAILPIGAYLPRWFMAPVHISPQEAVDAHEALKAQTSVAMHFGTFQLADDGEFNPPVRLKRTLLERERSHEFWVLGFGEGRDVPPLKGDERGSSSAE